MTQALYFCNDANMNVTALLEPDGDVAERYVYDPYGGLVRDANGNPLVHSADWSSTVTWSNSRKNEILFGGYRYDTESGLYHVRHRYYHPTVGRWIERDSIGYRDGLNLYDYARGMPSTRLDAFGNTVIFPFPGGVPSTEEYHKIMTAVNSLAAGVAWALNLGDDLAPHRSGDSFATFAKYCCTCYLYAVIGQAAARQYAEAYKQAARQETPRAEGEEKIRQEFGTGAETDFSGTRLKKRPTGPCKDLLLQGSMEHERYHKQTLDTLTAKGWRGELDPRAEWNRIVGDPALMALEEEGAVQRESECYQALRDPCIRIYVVEQL